MTLEALEAFGMGMSVIIYLLVERAGKVKLLATPRARFLAPGVLALVVVVAFYVGQSPRPALYVPLVKWLGLWVASMAVKSMAKDSERGGPPII